MKDYRQTSEDNQDSGILSNPISLLRNGYFIWNGGGPGVHGVAGYYWYLRSADTIYSSYLYFMNTTMEPRGYGHHGNGFAVLTGAIFQILHHSH